MEVVPERWYDWRSDRMPNLWAARAHNEGVGENRLQLITKMSISRGCGGVVITVMTGLVWR